MKELVSKRPKEGFQLDAEVAGKKKQKKKRIGAPWEQTVLLTSGGKKRTCCKKVRPGVFRRMYINRSSHCGLREARPI